MKDAVWYFTGMRTAQAGMFIHWKMAKWYAVAIQEAIHVQCSLAVEGTS